MKTTTTTAVDAAIAEGLSVFSARVHTEGDVREWLGHSWEEGGYRVAIDDDGNETPLSDVRGNTVATWSVATIDPASPAHQRLCQVWYDGE